MSQYWCSLFYYIFIAVCTEYVASFSVNSASLPPQESLKKCRSLHDGHNQNLEANLDVLLDRLRQGASQEVGPHQIRKTLSTLMHLCSKL